MTVTATSRTAKLEAMRARIAARPTVPPPAASTPGPDFCLPAAIRDVMPEEPAEDAIVPGLSAADALALRRALKRLLAPTLTLALIFALGWVLLQLPTMTAVYLIGALTVGWGIAATCVVQTRARRVSRRWP